MLLKHRKALRVLPEVPLGTSYGPQHKKSTHRQGGFFMLWTVQDSNLPPPHCKCGALPDELTARMLYFTIYHLLLPTAFAKCGGYFSFLPDELTAQLFVTN